MTAKTTGATPSAAPMHPEYPSQASMIAAVIQAVIERWGGVHFRTSLATSAVMGKRIADDVIGAYMKPR